MNLVVGLLTVILIFDCLVLSILVLMQMPKKEAGAGMAFGGGAADAMFGAGSGNALTHITKYAAGIFFGLALVLAVMTAHQANSDSSKFREELTKPGAAGTGSRIIAPPATSSSNAANPSGVFPGPADLTTLPASPSSNASPARSAAPASNSTLPPAFQIAPVSTNK